MTYDPQRRLNLLKSEMTTPYLRDTYCRTCEKPIQIGPNDFALCDECLDICTGHGLIEFD